MYLSPYKDAHCILKNHAHKLDGKDLDFLNWVNKNIIWSFHNFQKGTDLVSEGLINSFKLCLKSLSLHYYKHHLFIYFIY